MTGLWGLEQIKAFKSKIESESNDGVAIVYDNHKREVTIDTGNIKYVLISSARIDPRAYETNENSEEINKDEVILIDGEALSKMIIDHIDEIDPSIRHKLGLIKQFVHIDEYSHRD